MRRAVLVPLLLVLAPLAGLVPSGGSLTQEQPDRVFVLAMHGTSFNGFHHPDTPLLEATLGDRLRFVLVVPPTAEPHTFHLHGHPWPSPDTGAFVDTVLVMPGETHVFDVVAGGPDAQAGEWMYHCHVADHQAQGMWGVLRVHDGPVPLLPGAEHEGH